MAKNLSDYILLAEKDYEYKIKLATEVTEKQFDDLETLLTKYDLKEVKNITRLPIQKAPLDFQNLAPTEVYVIDIVTRLPISDTTLVEEIYRKVGINNNLIVVRGKNSPYEQELNKIDNKKEYVTKITDPDYKSDGPEKSNLYGDEYNKEMVETIVKELGTDPTPNEKKADKIFKKALEGIKR